MSGDARPQYRRQRRTGPRDGSGRGSGAGKTGGGGSSLGGRTTTRALIAVGAYVAQDLRDPYGVTRPLLRRTALRLAASRQATFQRLGDAYLRSDPPTPEEVTGRQSAQLLLPPGEPGQAPGARQSQTTSDTPAAAV